MRAELARETGGNPFLLIELIGCFDPDTDSFEPLSLHDALARKLGQLPAEAAQLLDVVAVSGQALLLEEASRTAGHELPPMATLTRMRNERLVRLLGPENQPLVDTYHDRVRETILDRMDEGTCKTIHRKLAEVIEQDMGGVLGRTGGGKRWKTVRQASKMGKSPSRAFMTWPTTSTLPGRSGKRGSMPFWPRNKRGGSPP